MITDPIVINELRRIAEKHGGRLAPEIVVEEARVDTSPLHNKFDWDDSEAAQHWRLHQARQLIRVVVSYQAVGDGKSIPCRVFVSLTPDREQDGGGYRLVTNVLGDPDQRRQLLADARAEMQRFRSKYQNLSELAEVFAAMDRVQEKPARRPKRGAA